MLQVDAPRCPICRSKFLVWGFTLIKKDGETMQVCHDCAKKLTKPKKKKNNKRRKKK